MHLEEIWKQSMVVRLRTRFNTNPRLFFKLILAITIIVLIFNSYYLFAENATVRLTETSTPEKSLPKYSNPCKGYSPRRCIRQFDKKPVGIMTSQCKGRLGNQMFSYAYLYAFATFNGGQGYMSAVNSNLISKYFKVSLDTMDFNLSSSIDWTFHTFAPENFKSLSSVLNHKFCHIPQVRRFFDDLRPQIQQEFQFHDEIQKRAEIQLSKAHLVILGSYHEKLYGAFRPQFVGVHVRRSDYISFIFPATPEFYYTAMMYFKSNYSNTIFIVSSEDLVWCKENFAKFASDGLRIYYLEGVSEDDGGLDLAVLVNCDHLIFGVGSFGFWAGYLNAGEVVYCSDCVTNGIVWRTDRNIYEGNYSNFVKPSWKGIFNNGSM